VTLIQEKEGAGGDSGVELSLQNKQATNPIINNETNDNRAVAQGDGLGRGSEPYDCWCNHNDRRDGRTTHVEQAVELGLAVIEMQTDKNWQQTTSVLVSVSHNY